MGRPRWRRTGPSPRLRRARSRWPTWSTSTRRSATASSAARSRRWSGRACRSTRFALRGWDADVADPADVAEARRARATCCAVARCRCSRAIAAALLRAPGARLARAARWRCAWPAAPSGRWPYHLIYLAEACLLCDWLQRAGVAHLHAHFGTNSAEVAMLARALGGPALQLHRARARRSSTARVAAPRRARSRAPAFVVAISSFGRSQLYRWVAADAVAEDPRRALRPRAGFLPATGERAGDRAAPGLRRPAVRAEGAAAAARGRRAARCAGRRRSSWCWPATARCAPTIESAIARARPAATACASPAGSAATRCATRSSPRARWCCPASPRACRS